LRVSALAMLYHYIARCRTISKSYEIIVLTEHLTAAGEIIDPDKEPDSPSPLRVISNESSELKLRTIKVIFKLIKI
jgi:hypothetical protein